MIRGIDGKARVPTVCAPGLLVATLLAGMVGLAGCGGTTEEPGQVPPKPVPVTLELDPGQSIAATVMESGTMPTRAVSGIATGDLASLDGATIYVVVVDPSSLFASSTIAATPDGLFTISLQGRTLPSPGRFTGTLEIHVSLDAGGARRFGGSPLLVPYDVTVLDALSLESTSLLVETPFGDPPSTTTVKATMTPYATGWSARLGTSQGCYGTGAPIDAAATPQRVGCAADGTISLSFLPAAPGTYTETLQVAVSVRYAGVTYAITEQVAITRVVTPTNGIDYVAYPAALRIERSPGDWAFREAKYELIPNAGVTVLFHGIEYLSNPAAADGHPRVAAWWQESPSQGSSACDGTGESADCLPEGTYTARVHYVVTRNGVDADVYFPITLEISGAGYFAAALGAFVDFEYRWSPEAAPSASRIQVVASSPSAMTLRTDQASTPTNYTLSDHALSGGGLYLSKSWSCSKDGSGCGATTYTPPAVIFPASTTPGFSETTVSSTSTGTSTRVVTVDGVESVTVPAGTFSALKITAHLTTSGYDGYNVTWWVDGIGRVKIANYPASNPASVQSWAMSAHGVAPVP